MRASINRHLRNRLAADQTGGVLVEFALLFPFLVTLLVGVLQVGLHVQNTNAVRNLASDGSRMAVVQYQQGNSISASQIEAMIRGRGVGPRYNLNGDRLTVVVTEEASRIGGVTEMSIRITYDAPDYLAFVDSDALRLVYQRPVFLLTPT